jgi:hypothetical protein
MIDNEIGLKEEMNKSRCLVSAKMLGKFSKGRGRYTQAHPRKSQSIRQTRGWPQATYERIREA